jgi:hypothetical protein
MVVNFTRRTSKPSSPTDYGLWLVGDVIDALTDGGGLGDCYTCAECISRFGDKSVVNLNEQLAILAWSYLKDASTDGAFEIAGDGAQGRIFGNEVGHDHARNARALKSTLFRLLSDGRLCFRGLVKRCQFDGTGGDADGKKNNDSDGDFAHVKHLISPYLTVNVCEQLMKILKVGNTGTTDSFVR